MFLLVVWFFEHVIYLFCLNDDGFHLFIFAGGLGDWLEVPAGAEHSAEVIGDATVVSLDAVRR